MFGEKGFEEIEIEQIDLDVDKSFDVTIDVSSVDNIISDLSFEEVSSHLEEQNKASETLEVTTGESINEEQEESVSLSSEELESILEGAEVEEVSTQESVELESASQVEGSVEMVEPVLGEVEGLEAEKLGEESISSVSESFIEATSKESEEGLVKTEEENLVVLSTDEYNKIVEESEKVPIVDKPLEEVIEPQVGESSEVGEPVSPMDLGIGEYEVSEEKVREGIEIEEFQEISEEMVMSKLEGGETREEVSEKVPESIVSSEEFVDLSSSLEGLEISEGEIGGEEIISSEVGVSEEFIAQEEVKTEEGKFELVDDISIELSGLSEESSSVMPDEVGLEEIQIEEIDTSKVTQEGILGIGFGEEGSVVPEVQTTEKISEEVGEEIGFGLENVEEVGVSEVGEVGATSTFEEFYEPVPFEESEVSVEEVREDKQEVIERALEGLGEQEKEDIKKVLLYLDSLLESLPEDKIKEFASSEYYDLYIKLFNKLNLK